ncbi:beta-lactamase/transpeptidase-like protein [Mycena vulgaris]|nr:beta-lactamase/transpeptidase-like protein [Mycena vulgaris]
MRPVPLTICFMICSILASAANSSPGLNATNILTTEVDDFINGVLAAWNTAGGAAVAVVRVDAQGTWSVETKGYGVAKADGTKVDPDTIFSLGSNSKLFDILATGLLISNQSLSPQISWTTKIAAILPDWKLIDPVASAESTITDLMSHRTGLPRHDLSYGADDDVPSLINRLRYLKPSTGFSRTLQYTNIMYAVLSYIPTALLPDKPPFARYVKQHLFDPLGLNSTTYSFAVANATGRMADGFVRVAVNTSENPVGRGIPLVVPYSLPNVQEDGDLMSGPGGVLSTATDAARWLQMLILNGQHPETDTTIVPAAVIHEVAKGVMVYDGFAEEPELSATVYGGGQIQSSYRGHVMVEHGGDFSGFHSQITRFLADGLGIAVLTNDDTFGALFREVIKYRIADQAFGLDPVDWNSRYLATVRPAAAASPAPPLALRSPLSVLPLVQGVYRNLGYGPDIALCVPSVSSPSSNCTTLLADLNSTFPTLLAPADVVWRWARLGADYVALTHWAGELFNVSGWRAIPTGDPSAPFWALDAGLEGAVVEFAIESGRITGFGMRGGIWGAGALVGEPQGESVEAQSEVWYEAV